VTVVPLLTDINEMDNIRCNFYCYKCEKFIGKDVGGFGLDEVATNGDEIVHGHFLASLVFLCPWCICTKKQNVLKVF
jgi:hypothetical protein